MLERKFCQMRPVKNILHGLIMVQCALGHALVFDWKTDNFINGLQDMNGPIQWPR